MINLDTEIEVKLDASGVDAEAFKAWALSKVPYSALSVSGPDYYYTQGENVIRHRVQPDGKQELTVKLRRSSSSTLNRMELDLPVATTWGPTEVKAWLGAIGFKSAINLVKNAYMMFFKEGKTHLCVVIYSVWRTDEAGNPIEKARQFVEVEVEKGSDVTPEHGKRRVNHWMKEIQEKFGVGAPLNESLWELYSGLTYKTVDKEKGND